MDFERSKDSSSDDLARPPELDSAADVEIADRVADGQTGPV